VRALALDLAEGEAPTGSNSLRQGKEQGKSRFLAGFEKKRLEKPINSGQFLPNSLRARAGN
jgi:hypothetical protein